MPELWEKVSEPPDGADDWTPIEIVHLVTGWQVEVAGEARGTVFPDLSGAHFFVGLLLQTPQFQGGQARIAYADRRGQADA